MPYFVILPSRLFYSQTNLEITLTFRMHCLSTFVVFFALLLQVCLQFQLNLIASELIVKKL